MLFNLTFFFFSTSPHSPWVPENWVLTLKVSSAQLLSVWAHRSLWVTWIRDGRLITGGKISAGYRWICSYTTINSRVRSFIINLYMSIHYCAVQRPLCSNILQLHSESRQKYNSWKSICNIVLSDHSLISDQIPRVSPFHAFKVQILKHTSIWIQSMWWKLTLETHYINHILGESLNKITGLFLFYRHTSVHEQLL